MGTEALSKITDEAIGSIVAPEADLEALDALLSSEAALYAAGYQDGHAAALLEADREVCDAVRRVMEAIRGEGLL